MPNETEKDNSSAKGGRIASDAGSEPEVRPHPPPHIYRHDVRARRCEPEHGEEVFVKKERSMV